MLCHMTPRRPPPSQRPVACGCDCVIFYYQAEIFYSQTFYYQAEMLYYQLCLALGEWVRARRREQDAPEVQSLLPCCIHRIYSMRTHM